MSKKTPAPKSASRSHATPRAFLGGVDPVQLVELLDNHFTDTGGKDGSPYQQLYRQSKAAFLAHDVAGVEFAKLLDEVDVSVGVQEAIRQAGFVQGFEVCRQLLLGELDLEALKGGAR